MLAKLSVVVLLVTALALAIAANSVSTWIVKTDSDGIVVAHLGLWGYCSGSAGHNDGADCSSFSESDWCALVQSDAATGCHEWDQLRNTRAFSLIALFLYGFAALFALIPKLPSFISGATMLVAFSAGIIASFSFVRSKQSVSGGTMFSPASYGAGFHLQAAAWIAAVVAFEVYFVGTSWFAKVKSYIVANTARATLYFLGLTCLVFTIAATSATQFLNLVSSGSVFSHFGLWWYCTGSVSHNDRNDCDTLNESSFCTWFGTVDGNCNQFHEFSTARAFSLISIAFYAVFLVVHFVAGLIKDLNSWFGISSLLIAVGSGIISMTVFVNLRAELENNAGGAKVYLGASWGLTTAAWILGFLALALAWSASKTASEQFWNNLSKLTMIGVGLATLAFTIAGVASTAWAVAFTASGPLAHDGLWAACPGSVSQNSGCEKITAGDFCAAVGRAGETSCPEFDQLRNTRAFALIEMSLYFVGLIVFLFKPANMTRLWGVIAFFVQLLAASSGLIAMASYIRLRHQIDVNGPTSVSFGDGFHLIVASWIIGYVNAIFTLIVTRHQLRTAGTTKGSQAAASTEKDASSPAPLIAGQAV